MHATCYGMICSVSGGQRAPPELATVVSKPLDDDAQLLRDSVQGSWVSDPGIGVGKKEESLPFQ